MDDRSWDTLQDMDSTAIRPALANTSRVPDYMDMWLGETQRQDVSEDSWEPRITQTGQIYYVNPETGAQSFDPPALPHDEREPLFAGPLIDLVNSWGLNNEDSSVPIADEVLEDYYDSPGPSVQATYLPPSSPTSALAPFHNNVKSGSLRLNGGTRHSSPPVYRNGASSDSTGISSPAKARSLPPGLDHGPHRSVHDMPRKRCIRYSVDATYTGPETARRLANELQGFLKSDPNHGFAAHLSSALEATRAVIEIGSEARLECPSLPRDGIEFVRERRTVELSGDGGSVQNHLAERLAQAAHAILILLFTSGKLVHPMAEADLSSTLATQAYIESSSNDPLTPFRRRVITMLSKLVLAVRAADATPERPADITLRVAKHAAELEEAIVTFSREIQSSDCVSQASQGPGILSPGEGLTGVGTAVMGGGLAAGWKGSGFLPLPKEALDSTPMRVLGTAIIKELNPLCIALEDNLTSFAQLVGIGYNHSFQSRSASPIDPYLIQGETPVRNICASISSTFASQVMEHCRTVISQLAAFLEVAECIDIARHLDFDGALSDDHHRRIRDVLQGDYDASIRQARLLVRKFEITKQTLYDQSAELLLATQNTLAAASLDGCTTNRFPHCQVPVLVLALKSSVDAIMETIEALLDVAGSQAEAVESGLPGTIGLRSSELDESSNRSPELSSRDSFLILTDDEPYVESIDRGLNPALTSLGTVFHSAHLDDTYGPMLNGLYLGWDHPGIEVDPDDDATSSDSSKKEDTIVSSPFTSEEALPNNPSSVSNAAANGHAGVKEPPPSEFRLPDGDVDDEENISDWSPRLMETDDYFAGAKVTKSKVKKLFNILGKETPPEVIKKQSARSLPSYMKPTYGPPDIIFHAEGGVRGGILPALVEHLTMHDDLDGTFNHTFLLTFKSFASLDDVVTELFKRFNIPQPDSLTRAQSADWTENKQKPVQLRTINMLRSLLEHVGPDEPSVMARIEEFALSIGQANMIAPKRQLLQSIKMKTDDAQAKKYTPNGLQDPPQPIMPKRLDDLALSDLAPLELARQLTIMESRLFARVQATEFLARGKARPSSSVDGDNIKSISDMSNKLSAWVTDCVLTKDDPKQRAIVLKYFIATADHCKRLKNFSSMFSLLAGLHSSSIRRLKRSWDMLSSKSITVLADLDRTIDLGGKFSAYHHLLERTEPPCVPYFGIYLTHLEHSQNGNNNFIQIGDTQVINFDKRQKAAQIYTSIERYQSPTYDLISLQPIIDFIETNMAASSLKEADFWDLSLALEPRETEDERMTRLLQESGFA